MTVPQIPAAQPPPLAARPRENGERCREAAKQVGNLADQLAGLDHRAALAAVRGEMDELCESAEQLLTLHARFAELYRTFLVQRGTFPGPQRASW